MPKTHLYINMRIIHCLLLTFLVVFAEGIRKLRGSIEDDIQTRIIGGEDAPAGLYKYAAAVYKTTADGTYFCTGVLINRQWVLTAAHCVQNATNFVIHLGTNKLTATDENRMTLATDFAVIHWQYDPATLENDLGLVKFRMLINYTEYIQPIDYATTDIEAGETGTIIGWGQTSDNMAGLTENLQQVDVVAISNDECKITFGQQILDSFLCVSGNYNEGFCNGDSGGPLIRKTLGGEEVVAVASFLSGNGCESTDPKGYTRTSFHHEWITAIIQNV